MDGPHTYRSPLQSTWERIVTVAVDTIVIVSGAINRNPALLVLGLAGLVMLAVNIARPGPPPHIASREDAAAQLRAHPVRPVMLGLTLATVPILGGLWYLHAGAQTHASGAKWAGIVLIGVGALFAIGLVLAVIRVRRLTRSTRA